MPRGGARPNSGPKIGSKHYSTLTKEAQREHVRQFIGQYLDEMLGAQVRNAIGIGHLMLRDPKTGKFERVASDTSDPEVAKAQIDAAIQSGNSCWIYTKDPSVQAFTDLMNRCIDKPAEQVQQLEHVGELKITWMTTPQ